MVVHFFSAEDDIIIHHHQGINRKHWLRKIFLLTVYTITRAARTANCIPFLLVEAEAGEWVCHPLLSDLC